jgi:TorA maturation chaperone TorD
MTGLSMMYSQDEWTALLTGEALTFSLLGRALYSEPDRAWLQSLAADDIFAEAPLGNEQPDVQAGLLLLQDWTLRQRDAMNDEAFEALKADYTRLFQGPGKVLAPPWESVYFSEERMTFQQQTLDVRNWYRRFGLQAVRLYQEPDDHIGLELIFVSHLAQRSLQALEQNDIAAFETLIAAQRDFLTAHLLKWAALWGKAVRSQVRTDFFRGIALLTQGVLADVNAKLNRKSMPEAAR